MRRTTAQKKKILITIFNLLNLVGRKNLMTFLLIYDILTISSVFETSHEYFFRDCPVWEPSKCCEEPCGLNTFEYL